MQPVTDRDTLREIIELAQKYLAPHQPPDYKLEVDPNSIQQDDEWYYVVVQPSRTDVRSYDYSSRLAEAEQDLEDNEHRRILLVPALPN